MEIDDYKKLQKDIEDIEYEHNLHDYHAFIFWFIETEFEMSREKILNSICDGTHDKGIDAVIIDPIEMKVIIIQSKYERAGGQVQINENEIKLLASVKGYFDSRDALEAGICRGNHAAKRLMNEAFESLRRKKYSLELIFISTHKNAPNLDDLVYKTFGFSENEFRIYHFERIMQRYHDRLRDFTPSIGSYNLPFVDDDKSVIKTSKNKSWVLTVSADEIRIMVNKFDDKLFRKNVRNFLGKSRTNRKIKETLSNEPDKFWYYNNGITILCERANIVMEGKYIRMENPQVVNGCQTVKSIQEFNGELKSEVMVRIIESIDHDFINSLTFYQNSSNPVRNRDLKSNDPVQIRLKNELRRRGYFYEVKRGEDYKSLAKKYPALKSQFNGNVVNNEEIAKLLATIKLGPAVALSSGSDKFFGNVYEEVFTRDLSTFTCLTPYFLYDIARKTYVGKPKRFHDFEKDWVFKNRAIFYVVAFLRKTLDGSHHWEKRFVELYEMEEDENYERFFSRLEKIINKYFEIIYSAWEQSDFDYYNTFLQNTNTLKKIRAEYKEDIDSIEELTKKAFEDFLNVCKN